VKMSGASISEVAALVGDPSRAAMLDALMDGRALTAAELAAVAGVTPQTASGHLGQLTEARLLVVRHQGRHRYHAIADTTVAQMLESIMHVAARGVPAGKPVRTGPLDRALKQARTCYDHLAGELGVALAESLLAGGYIRLGGDVGTLTDAGAKFLAGIGIDINGARAASKRRPVCRPCLDWSERRPHIAGLVGQAICSHCIDAGWVKQQAGTRALLVTRTGRLALVKHFGIEYPLREAPAKANGLDSRNVALAFPWHR
jgi:DNA-binding transcriptional ArsR family regulator